MQNQTNVIQTGVGLNKTKQENCAFTECLGYVVVSAIASVLSVSCAHDDEV